MAITQNDAAVAFIVGIRDLEENEKKDLNDHMFDFKKSKIKLVEKCYSF